MTLIKHLARAPSIVTDFDRKCHPQVMMTADEARTVGAREVVLGGHHSSRTPRSRSNSAQTVTAHSPLHAQPASAVSDTADTPTASLPSLPSLLQMDDAKGKRA